MKNRHSLKKFYNFINDYIFHEKKRDADFFLQRCLVVGIFIYENL